METNNKQTTPEATNLAANEAFSALAIIGDNTNIPHGPSRIAFAHNVCRRVFELEYALKCVAETPKNPDRWLELVVDVNGKNKPTEEKGLR